MSNRWQFPGAVWDIWRNNHSKPSTILACQQARLAELIQFARTHSPLYRKLYSHLPQDVQEIGLLPIVTKSELMANFDSWVTDQAVTKAGVEDFISNKATTGHSYLDRYAVWSTSGVTGKPGIFLHDERALAIYTALIGLRGYRWMTPKLMWKMLSGGSWAMLAATEGHFALNDLMERIRISYPMLSQRIRPLSVLTPLPELVQILNNFRPAILLGYPSAMKLLAQEQQMGRLHIKPMIVITGGEWLSPAVRTQLEEVFRCLVRDNYGASEFLFVAFECNQGRLHINEDWVLLEPVDKMYRPVPAGQPSHTVLLTNLANRVQPIIRYDLGDSITVCPDPCPCGSPLTAIRVEGRRDEILYMQNSSGAVIPLVPLALISIFEETPGIRSFQVIQTSPATLRIRLEVEPGADRTQTWGAISDRLHHFLSTQGLSSVILEQDPKPPEVHPVSGKFRLVMAATGVANP